MCRCARDDLAVLVFFLAICAEYSSSLPTWFSTAYSIIIAWCWYVSEFIWHGCGTSSAKFSNDPSHFLTNLQLLMSQLGNFSSQQ